MSIGDLIARFDDEAVAAEAVVALGDVALLAKVATVAAQRELTFGEFASSAVERFARDASDEEWIMLMGRLARVEDPGAAFLHQVLSTAVAESSRAPQQRVVPDPVSEEI